MKTKIRYNHAAYFGNFDIDALEAYLPREIEISEQDENVNKFFEETEGLEINLKMIELSSGIFHSEKYIDEFQSTIVFEIEGSPVKVQIVHGSLKDHRAIENFNKESEKDKSDYEDIVRDILEIKSNYVKDSITKIVNDKLFEMVNAVYEGQDNEIEKQKTEEFIRTHF